ncbi:MAG: dihydrodipicolinate synthase family protein [Chloroherpetonaceae bacterium]|nr:dihydrodipicolinate synthase family protein [Chthonomonadaceae bacterium]MDW8206291.1 dihydrodipicolinate synthase family protein [Chloroherpetonaceae bacterium]
MDNLTIEDCLSRIRPRRRITGIAATLLPFDAHGRIAEEAFVAHLRHTHVQGLYNAVNMDTGYVQLLDDAQKQRVLELTRDALGPGVPFFAGACMEGREGDIVSLYRREIERIERYGGTPVLFQTARMHALPPVEKAHLYQQLCAGSTRVLAFELGRMFAPGGEIWDEETFLRLLEIPQIVGAKHSSLDRNTELRRLALRDRYRPEFAIYTGNDLAIDMVIYGSDYLLGLATFCPEKFAERDALWHSGDPGFFLLNDALQHLGNVAFRAPVPAYRHSAAIFLHRLGRIPTPATHPHSPARPSWEAELLTDCMARLGLTGN